MTNALPKLLSPIRLGDIDLPHRVVMAPLTRSRAKQPGDIPTDLNATYYGQRANPKTGASLIIAEATQVSPQGKGYAFTPGIHTDDQARGWKLVTDAVHARGGKIVLQLWHVGRISHVDLQPGKAKPVAPSAIAAKSQTYTSKESGMVPTSEPRALETSELPGIVEQFRRGAELAKKAGFDGVEIHGANGYLLDQFTRSGTNRRTDDYGGPAEQRIRLPLEVAEAVVRVWGPGRVGYRISPLGRFNDISDENPIHTFGHLAYRLGQLKLAYLHVVEEFGPTPRDAASEYVFGAIRHGFRDGGGSAYIGNGSYNAATAEDRIARGLCDAVAFGKLFISNPDLTERFRRGGPFNPWDESTFYGGTEKGYTDYPPLKA